MLLRNTKKVINFIRWIRNSRNSSLMDSWFMAQYMCTSWKLPAPACHSQMTLQTTTVKFLLMDRASVCTQPSALCRKCPEVVICMVSWATTNDLAGWMGHGMKKTEVWEKGMWIDIEEWTQYVKIVVLLMNVLVSNCLNWHQDNSLEHALVLFWSHLKDNPD